MIIFLYGRDIFRSRRYLKKMTAKFKADRDPQGLNVVCLDCEKEKDAGRILEQLLAAPFLAERRMVVLENLLISRHKDLQNDLLNRIKEKSLPESNVVIFWEGTDKFQTKTAKSLFECLLKEKFSQNFEEIKRIRLGEWVMAEVKERGGLISNQAVQYLVDNAGHDMWMLNSLIDQLVSYTDNRGLKESKSGQNSVENASLEWAGSSSEIVLTDVMLFLNEKADDNIFNLVDAIIGKQDRQAYKMIREQYRRGEDVRFIFSMILRQFRILLELRDLFDREDNTQSNILARKLNLHPFVVKKSLPMVRRYNMKRLKNIYRELLEFDKKIKMGYGREDLFLDLFVGKVCYIK